MRQFLSVLAMAAAMNPMQGIGKAINRGVKAVKDTKADKERSADAIE